MDIRSFIPLPIGPTDTVSRNVYRYRWQTQRPFRSSDSESLPAYPPWAMFLRACWPRLLVPRRGRAFSSESRGRSPKVLQRLLCCLQFRIFSVIACIAARVCLSWSRLSLSCVHLCSVGVSCFHHCSPASRHCVQNAPPFACLGSPRVCTVW